MFTLDNHIHNPPVVCGGTYTATRILKLFITFNVIIIYAQSSCIKVYLRNYMLVWLPCIHIGTCTYACMYTSFLCTHIDIQASIVIMHCNHHKVAIICVVHICTYIITMAWTMCTVTYNVSAVLCLMIDMEAANS